jgi:hypothetical protein
MADYREFAKTIKEKYPQYSGVDDLELAKRVVDKYPQYKDKVTFEVAPVVPEKSPLQLAGETALNVTSPIAAGVALSQPREYQAAKIGGEQTLQGATLGYGLPALQAVGYKPEEATVPQKLAFQTLGAVATGKAFGAIKGIAELNALGQGKALPTIAKGIGLGAAYNPSEEKIAGVVERVPGAVLGGLGGLAFRGGQMVKQTRPEQKIGLFDKSVDGLRRSYGKQMEQYGQQLDSAIANNPGKSINVSDLMNDLRLQAESGMINPKVRATINSIPELKAMYDNPEVAKNISANAMQGILSKVNAKIGVNKLSGKQMMGALDRDVKQLRDELKGEMIHSFPEMGEAGTQYAKFMNGYRTAKREIYAKKWFENIKNDYQNPVIKKQIDETLPKEVVKALGSYKEAAKVMGVLKYVALTAGGVGIAGAGWSLMEKLKGKR